MGAAVVNAHIHAAEMEELGRKLWGEPNAELSTRTDLRFGSHGSKSINRTKGTWYDHEAGEGGCYWDLYEKVHGHKPKLNRHAADIAAVYDYHDAGGRLLFQVVRKIPKKFVQRRPDGNGGWISNLQGVRRVLYHLPELVKAQPGSIVFIAEGEKDVDRLRQSCLTATTCPGGADKWREEYNQYFRGLHVVVVADNDPQATDGAGKLLFHPDGRPKHTGQDHAADVGRALRGIAASVTVLSLPEKDVSDWLHACGTTDELAEIAQWRRGEDDLPGYGNKPEINCDNDNSPPQSQPNASEFECSLAALQHRVFEPIKWIVPDYLPEGLTLFAGKPKIGKSWLVLNIALAVARGKEVLGKFVEQGDVLYCGLEDGLRRMQSRVSKILPLNRDWPANFTFRHRLDPLDAGGLDVIETWLRDHPNRRLVVIDTLGRVKGMKAARKELYQYDYRLMAGLQELATRYRVAIVVVHHVRKSNAEDVLDQVSGTTGIAGAADTVIVLGRTQHGVRLYLRGRDAEEQDKTIEFDPETGIWSVTGDFDEADATSPTHGLRKQIADLLGNSPIALKPTGIAERLGKRSDDLRKVLYRMLHHEPPQVIKTSDGAYTSAQKSAPGAGA
jgi:hypothetical protein